MKCNAVNCKTFHWYGLFYFWVRLKIGYTNKNCKWKEGKLPHFPRGNSLSNPLFRLIKMNNAHFYY